MGIKVCGTGAVVGGRSVTNKEFVEICRKNDEKTDSARKFAQKAKNENKETDPNWILKRTGIKKRVWIDNWHERNDGLEGPGITLNQWEQDPSSGINTSDLASEAAIKAIKDASMIPEDIDCSIWASLTPDHHFPGLGNYAFNKTGLKNGTPAFSIMQQCPGFIYGVSMAHSFIKAGVYKKVLVVGAEIQSVWQDLTTRGRGAAPIFGDGAAAFVFCNSNDGSDILSCQLGSNGDTEPLNTLAFNSACGETWEGRDSNYKYIHPQMLGSKVFKHAVKGTIDLITNILETAQKTYNDVDWFIPHQANHNINAFVAGSLGSEVEVRKDDAPLIKDNRWLSNIEKYGNLSAASIPLLFHENVKNGKIKRGDLCAIAAYGAGFNWGAMLLKY